jgi:hypothetical protein
VWLVGACGAGRGKGQTGGNIHSKLTEQKEKQNSTQQKQNNTEAEQKQSEATVHTNTTEQKQTFSRCFSFVVSLPHSVDGRRTMDTAIMWRCREHCVLATLYGQPQDSGHSNHVTLQRTLCLGHILWTAAGQWTQQSCGAAGNTVSWPHPVDSCRTVDTAIMWRCKEHCVVATFCGQTQYSGHINHVALQGTLCPGHILWTAAGQWTHHSCGAARNTVSWPHPVDSRRTVDTKIM